MYFKNIEMVGFKSFADRTLVNLEPGTTAIVGPNGCGKSNILDAVRWALGEQSAKTLRGSHMQDVIFNGSEERAPTGMAEVSLTFDNSNGKLPVDFAEVQVTRRVYRSGESEYLMNKAPCRLRDIQELFMDTGIGTNAYSLIGQGKIDMVLSSKPEDRRYLFEEAAGIIKYKSRKRVAMRRLDTAEQNLLRLGDIIAEVERQLRSLKRQVNAAIRYREMSETLQELEIRAAWLKHVALSSAIEETREKFGTAQEAYEGLNAETSKLEARHEELGLAKLEIDRVLLARREGVHELDTEMEKIERQIALIRQQIAFGREQREQAAEAEENYTKKSQDIAAEQERQRAHVAQLAEDAQGAQASVDAKETETAALRDRVAELEESLEADRERAVEGMNRRARNQTDTEKLAVQIENIDAQLQSVYERQQAAEAKSEEHLTALHGRQQQQADAQSKRDAAVVRLAELREEGKRLDTEEQSLDTQWQNTREQKSSQEARLNSLREMRDSYEGFAAGVRAVMKAKREEHPRTRGVIGPVGDLLSTEKQYERAIEATLGYNVNNIVVETGHAAKSAVEYLKGEQAGRVTFLPLDMIRPWRQTEGQGLAGRAGVVGRAIDFVHFAENIRPAVEYLLGNTLVTETIDVAIEIARTADRYPRLVTLDGEVISPSGAVTGGRTRHESRGVIGRSAEIDELTRQLAETGEALASLDKKRDGIAAAIKANQEAHERVSTGVESAEKALAEAGIAVARLSTELENLTETREALQAERDRLAAQREELENRRRALAEQAGALETDEERLQQALDQAREAASKARHELSVSASALSDQRVKLAELKQNAEEAARAEHRLKEEYESAVAEAARRRELIGQLEENERQLQQEIAHHEEHSKALSESKEEARKKVVEAENDRQKLLDESETIEKSLRETREKARAAQNEVHQLELSLRRDEDQRAFFEERILSEYHVALSGLAAEDVGEDDLEDAERDEKVAELKEKLQKMGQVNLGAIEEYDELQKRHEFLVAQEADLRKARESLLEVITRIDKTITAMFLDTFDRVAEHFKQHFRRLFNGGQARIYLIDETDPLESGIEIEARPPGKKPQSISLLSGGEQAMTAIALLFSIFKAKPSPFCVLDEVDAPLDDANIGRFLGLLEEFTKDSQFIIITHNKQTMSRADALYGVTMQERGVSTLVSVRLDGGTGAESAA